ncbi:MAG: DUF3822 family protein [Flavobacteriaceae bacterium]|nr:DUF3822 family protein [Flavobacteriaceae bacterium]
METGQKYMAVTSNLESNNQNSLILSIQVSLNGLSFCILDAPVNKIIQLYTKNFTQRLNPINTLSEIEKIFDSQLSGLSFNQVIVTHVNELATLVPKDLFDVKYLADYLKFNNKIFASDFIAHDEIENHDIMSIYVPFVNINNYFIDKFGQFIYQHYSTTLIKTIIDNNRYNLNKKVYAHIQNKQFELVVIDSGKLVFFNSFIYETSEDFIYYTLFAFEQLGLDPEKVDFNFIGEIQNEEHALFTIASQYIEHVTFGSRYKHVLFDAASTPETNHQHFTLIHALS